MWPCHAFPARLSLSRSVSRCLRECVTNTLSWPGICSYELVASVIFKTFLESFLLCIMILSRRCAHAAARAAHAAQRGLAGVRAGDAIAYSTPLAFPLLEKRRTGLGSWVLKFEVPAAAGDLAQLPLPSGVKLVLNGKEKSYSPVTLHTADAGTFDLVVKPYAPDVEANGGFSAFLCDLTVGQTAPMYVKPPRTFHGSQQTVGRYDNVGLVCGGTGVAPLLQIARAELEGGRAHVHLLSINKGSDVLMQADIDLLSESSGGRLHVTYLDTNTSGRGNAALAVEALGLAGLEPEAGAHGSVPSVPSSKQRMVYVCGTDGFVEHWCGGIVRDADNKKMQGPVQGVLAEVGLQESEVYKF